MSLGAELVVAVGFFVECARTTNEDKGKLVDELDGKYPGLSFFPVEGGVVCGESIISNDIEVSYDCLENPAIEVSKSWSREIIDFYAKHQKVLDGQIISVYVLPYFY